MSMKALKGGSHWNEKKFKNIRLSSSSTNAYLLSLLTIIKIIISQSKSLPPDLSNLLSKTPPLLTMICPLYIDIKWCAYICYWM